MQAEVIEDDKDTLRTIVDIGIYSRTALLKVAHSFTDVCYVRMQEVGERSVEVHIRSMTPGQDCSQLAGRLMNALLDQTLRERIAEETEPIRNVILAHALSNTTVIRPDLEYVDPTNDPRAIAVPDRQK